MKHFSDESDYKYDEFSHWLEEGLGLENNGDEYYDGDYYENQLINDYWNEPIIKHFQD